MSVKSIADRERKAYTQLIHSLNRDDATVQEIEEAIDRRVTIIHNTPSSLDVSIRLQMFRDVIYDCLFVDSDIQIKRRVAGELNSILFPEGK